MGVRYLDGAFEALHVVLDDDLIGLVACIL